MTGVTGFVGRVLCDQLSQAGYLVRAALRVDRPMPANVSERVTIGDIGSTTDWRQALIGVEGDVQPRGQDQVFAVLGICYLIA